MKMRILAMDAVTLPQDLPPFDPEKVERWDVFPDTTDEGYFFAERTGSAKHRHPEAVETVLASNYDQLLARYQATPSPTVWILSKSSSGGPNYDVEGVFESSALALEAANGEIHPLAGRLESHGGIGWNKLTNGRMPWKLCEDGSLYTWDASIAEYTVVRSAPTSEASPEEQTSSE
jgi:hypothetical protein